MIHRYWTLIKKTVLKNKLLSILIFTGFITHMVIIMPSGSHYCFEGKCGLYFWGVQGRDAIWHLAVSAVSFSKYPFIHPTYSGALLSGYNILLDFIVFLISKLGISIFFINYKLLPIIWFGLFTLVIYKLSKNIHKSPLFLILMLFLFYFAGSFSYFFTLRNSGTIWGSGGLLSMQSMLTLTNLQLAFSYVALIVILLIITKNHLSIKNGILLGLLVFIQLGLKFYGGVISCFIIGVYLIEILIQKKYRFFLLYSFIILVGSISPILLFYNPFDSLKTGSALILSPFAHAHAIIEEPTLFYLKNMTNARYFLYAQQKFSLRLLGIESLSILLFLFFNLGTRFFGLCYFLIQLFRKKVLRIELYIFAAIFVGTALTMLFIQKGDWWNTIQFFYYSIFLSNVFFAKTLFHMIKKIKVVGLILVTLLIIATVIGSIDVLSSFITFNHVEYISDEEVRILSYLKKLTPGVVYAPYFNSKLKIGLQSPLPLYTSVDTCLLYTSEAETVSY